jgi:PAS domain S-box-containing protein
MSGPERLVADRTDGRLARALLHDLFFKNPVASVLTGLLDGRIVEVNDAGCHLFGFTSSELIGHTVGELGLYEHKRDRSVVVRELEGEHTILRRNLFIRTKSGATRNILLNATMIEIEAVKHVLSSFVEYPSMAGSSLPIAQEDNHSVQEGLVAQGGVPQATPEERLRWALQSAGGGVWDFDLITGIAWWSEEMYALWGVPPGTTMDLENSLSIVQPEDRDRVAKTVGEAIAAGAAYRSEFRIQHPRHGERWMISRGKPFFDGSGRAIRLLGISIDITARKKEEERLHHLDGVLRAMRNVGMLITRERDRSRLLTQACALLTADRGYTSAFIAFREPDDRFTLITEESETSAFEILRSNVERGILPACCRSAVDGDDVVTLACPAVECHDCVRFHLRTNAATLAGRLWHDGRDFGVLTVSLPSAMAHDVEERELFKEFTDELALALHLIETGEEKRRYVDALKASEQRLLLFIEHAPAAIAIFDRDMRYLAASGRWIDDYHLSGKDIIGQSHYAIFPEITEGWKAVHRAGMAGEVTCNEEDRFERADGSVQWLRWEVHPWKEANGGVGGIIIMSEDITERKEAELSIQSSLREKEVLLREIHHRVKNNLQVISSLLNMQSGRLTDSATREALQESRNRVRSMALVHERLYRSGNLARIDFAMYLQDVTGELHRSYEASHVRLECTTEPVQMDIDMAVPCGLIVNELVSNALKHAFPDGRQGRITVSLKKVDDTHAELAVADDGVGLPGGFDVQRVQTMGMTILHALVGQLDARLSIDAAPGSRFTIILPLLPA